MINIEAEHPDYLARRLSWNQYSDLYAGGHQLLKNRSAYIDRRHNEPGDLYAERLSRTYYENYIGSIVDWYAATLFRREPVMTFEGSNETGRRFFAEFVDDCDLRGTNLTDFLRRRFADALVYGSSFVLVDFPKPPKRPGNRAEEDQLGASRAYLIGFSPLELTNWNRDDKGRLEWVVLRTERQAPDGMGGHWTTETRWTYYDRECYRRYRRRGRNGNPELEDSGPHGLARQGRVPLFTLDIPEGLWLLNRGASLQMEHMNKSNALAWAISTGLFAMPVIYSDSSMSQTLGESFYLQLGRDDKFTWAEPDGRACQVAAANLTRLQEEIYRVCYLSHMGGPLGTAAAQSGLSKARDYQITQEVLRSYGDAVKDVTRRVLTAVEEARDDGLRVEVSGLDEFDVADFSQELSDAERLLNMGIESPTFKKQVLRKLALKFLSDVRQDVKEEIAAEIEAAHGVGEKQTEGYGRTHGIAG